MERDKRETPPCACCRRPADPGHVLLRLPQPARRGRRLSEVHWPVVPPAPLVDLFLPASRTDAFVEAAIKDLTETEVGASGVVLLYPFPRARLHLPLLRMPDEETVFLFTLLRTASHGAESPQDMVEANRPLFLRAQALGGYQYPVGSIPTTPEEWRTHYGPSWAAFEAAHERDDPDGILTAGRLPSETVKSATVRDQPGAAGPGSRRRRRRDRRGDGGLLRPPEGRHRAERHVRPGCGDVRADRDLFRHNRCGPARREHRLDHVPVAPRPRRDCWGR